MDLCVQGEGVKPHWTDKVYVGCLKKKYIYTQCILSGGFSRKRWVNLVIIKRNATNMHNAGQLGLL